MPTSQPFTVTFPDDRNPRCRVRATAEGVDIAERVLSLHLAEVSTDLARAIGSDADPEVLTVLRDTAGGLAHLLHSTSAAGGSWLKRLRDAARTSPVEINEIFVAKIRAAHAAAPIELGELKQLETEIEKGRRERSAGPLRSMTGAV